MGTADVKPSTAAELTPLLKERPSAAEAKAWYEDNLPRLPADQRAAILGLTPRGALQYDADPVPAALSESTGSSATMVAQREATRFTITSSNVTKAKMLESFNAELSNSLFTSIELAAKTNAPLLVKKLKRDHPQGGGFAGYYDGVAAWKALVARPCRISQTDAEHIDRARSGEVSGVAGKPAARDKGFDCCVRLADT